MKAEEIIQILKDNSFCLSMNTDAVHENKFKRIAKKIIKLAQPEQPREQEKEDCIFKDGRYCTNANTDYLFCIGTCPEAQHPVSINPKPDTSQVETAEEILELNTGHSIDYLRRNAFSVDDVINAMYKFASQRKEVTDDDIENWIKTRHFTGSGQNDYAATLRDGMRIGAKALRDNKIG